METKLTRKQAAFVAEYLVDLNAAQAAIRAGYSVATAREIGCENLAKPYIASAIQEAMKERSDRTQINADYVLSRLVEIDQMDTLDILAEDGAVKPVSEWPKIWRQFISGFDVSEIFAGAGGDRAVASVLKKIKWPDKVRNLELLGKHVQVQAFKDRVEHSGDLNLGLLTVEQLQSRRENLLKSATL
jgi:phage terminase small subunit